MVSRAGAQGHLLRCGKGKPETLLMMISFKNKDWVWLLKLGVGNESRFSKPSKPRGCQPCGPTWQSRLPSEDCSLTTQPGPQACSRLPVGNQLLINTSARVLDTEYAPPLKDNCSSVTWKRTVHNPGGESEFREFNDYFLFPVTDNLSLVFGDEIISNIHR